MEKVMGFLKAVWNVLRKVVMAYWGMLKHFAAWGVKGYVLDVVIVLVTIYIIVWIPYFFSERKIGKKDRKAHTAFVQKIKKQLEDAFHGRVYDNVVMRDDDGWKIFADLIMVCEYGVFVINCMAKGAKGEFAVGYFTGPWEYHIGDTTVTKKGENPFATPIKICANIRHNVYNDDKKAPIYEVLVYDSVVTNPYWDMAGEKHYAEEDAITSEEDENYFVYNDAPEKKKFRKNKSLADFIKSVVFKDDLPQGWRDLTTDYLDRYTVSAAEMEELISKKKNPFQM